MFPMKEEKSLIDRIEEKGEAAVLAVECLAVFVSVFVLWFAGCR